ncbi:MAG: hypothetical protein IJ428_06180 [Clostridia bacterium]|nr:hypothetical protein [Clostridia bacterium]
MSEGAFKNKTPFRSFTAEDEISRVTTSVRPCLTAGTFASTGIADTCRI